MIRCDRVCVVCDRVCDKVCDDRKCVVRLV